MGQFEDEYLVKLHGVVTEIPNAMIVLELMPKGDLREFLIDIKEMYETNKYNYINYHNSLSLTFF